MHIRRLLVGLGALFFIYAAGYTAAHAAPPPNITMTVGVCDPNYPKRCAAPDASGALPITGTISATTSATASAAPTPVTAGTGKPLNEGLFSDLFTTLTDGAGNIISPMPKTGGSVALPAITTGGATPYHFISTASTNSTLVSTGAHTLYSLTLTGLNTTAAYVRLYDAAGAPTCSSATGAIHTYLVIGSATQQGGMIVPIPAQGEVLASGLGFCITGGSADTDNTSGPAGVLVNASYK